MKVITDDSVVYQMSSANRPVFHVEPGEIVIFETKDCFSNQIRSERDLFSAVDWARVNPATGPLAIKGAESGDALVVDILDVEVKHPGIMVAVPGMGAAGHLIFKTETRIIPIVAGSVVINDKLRLPVMPMVGVIGTAPAGDPIPCGTPGHHGGNLDTRHITKGARVYLPVFVQGGNLCIGDLHALMGDGEVVVCGVEVAGRVTVRVNLLKNINLKNPILETAESYYTIASAETLDRAVQQAFEDMLNLVMSRTGLDVNSAAMILSVAGHLEISQVVDPLKTARMRLPKTVACRLGISI